MYKVRHFATKKILLNVYYALIYSLLVYAIPVWGNADATYLNNILILQKKVVRMITFRDGLSEEPRLLAHSAPIFKELEVLTVYDIYNLQTAKFVHESINCNNPSQFHQFYMYTPCNHNTYDVRNLNLRIPMARTKHYGLNSIKNRGAHIWNDIPHNLRDMMLKTFTIHLKKSFVLKI